MVAMQDSNRTICGGLGLTHGFGKVDIVQKVLNFRACSVLESNELSSAASTGSSCGTMRKYLTCRNPGCYLFTLAKKRYLHKAAGRLGGCRILRTLQV